MFCALPFIIVNSSFSSSSIVIHFLLQAFYLIRPEPLYRSSNEGPNVSNPFLCFLTIVFIRFLTSPKVSNNSLFGSLFVQHIIFSFVSISAYQAPARAIILEKLHNHYRLKSSSPLQTLRVVGRHTVICDYLLDCQLLNINWIHFL